MTAPVAVAPILRLSQYWPRRFTLVLLSFGAVFICYMDRVNMSVAIIPMSKELGWEVRHSRCCSPLHFDEKCRPFNDDSLREGRSIFKTNLLTLIGSLSLRNLTVGPMDDSSIHLQNVQRSRGKLDRDGVPRRVSTVEVIPLPEW